MTSHRRTHRTHTPDCALDGADSSDTENVSFDNLKERISVSDLAGPRMGIYGFPFEERNFVAPCPSLQYHLRLKGRINPL